MSSTLQFQLNPPIDNAKTFIAYDEPPILMPDGSVDGDFDEGGTNENGYKAYLNVEPRHVHVLIRAKGFEDVRFDTPMPHDDLITVELRALPLQRLRMDGRHFVTDAGRFSLKAADSFQAYDRFLSGEINLLIDIFRQLQAKGFNAIRVFGMDKNIPEQLNRPPFKPQDFGQRYYDELPHFCRLAADYGLYVYFVVFADTGDIMPNEAEQIAHFDKVVAALKQAPNTLGSLGNELRQHENFVDKTKMHRPSGIAFSSGSEGMDEPTSPPWWDFDEFHPRRDRPSSIKDCCVVDHPNYLEHGLAVVIDEPDRFGSQGNPDAEYCALQAGASVESAAGICFHSKNGVYALPLDPETERCADAFMRVLTGV